MRVNKVVLLTVIMFSLMLTACAPSLTEGTIVNKQYTPRRTTISHMYINKMVVPRTRIISEKFILTIQGEVDGVLVEQNRYVNERYYNSVEIGDEHIDAD